MHLHQSLLPLALALTRRAVADCSVNGWDFSYYSDSKCAERTGDMSKNIYPPPSVGCTKFASIDISPDAAASRSTSRYTSRYDSKQTLTRLRCHWSDPVLAVDFASYCGGTNCAVLRLWVDENYKGDTVTYDADTHVGNCADSGEAFPKDISEGQAGFKLYVIDVDADLCNFSCKPCA